MVVTPDRDWKETFLARRPNHRESFSSIEAFVSVTAHYRSRESTKRFMLARILCPLAALSIAAARPTAPLPSFPGDFIRHAPMSRTIAERECLSLGENLFDKTVAPLGDCRPLGLHDVGRAAGKVWVFGEYQRSWLLAADDTVSETEIVLFTRPVPNSADSLQPIWHYRYEREMLRSVRPQVAAVTGGAVLLSIDECVNGTGGCSQAFALLGHGSPKAVGLGFLDSLNRRFPDAIRHGFHVDLRTLRGSAAVYSADDANCCPQRIAEFSVRLRGASLELATLRLRRSN